MRRTGQALGLLAALAGAGAALAAAQERETSALVDQVERSRLIDRGLALFFDRPGEACRTWLRLLRLDADDPTAARYVQLLGADLDAAIHRLESEGESHLLRAEFARAAALVERVRELECLYRRADAYAERVRAARLAALAATLDGYQRSVAGGDCASSEAGLEELVAEPLLSAEQTAGAYLALGVCRELAGALPAARFAFARALDFSADAALPANARPSALALFDAVRAERQR